MKKKRTTSSAVSEIYEKYGNKITTLPTFIFRGVDYKETFVCFEHGEFETSFFHLMKASKYGCRSCSPFGPKGWEYMKSKILHKHGELYEYYLNDADYTSGSKLKIICRKHGVFEQSYSDHLSGCGCPECATEAKEILINDFLLNSISHHGNSYRYNYVFEDYKRATSKIRIICPKHGIFKQQANDHGRGVGCPSCNSSSKGENLIRNFLIRHHIEYTTQKTFHNCIRNKGKLKYDFYLPEYNILLEYDGKQHYEEGYRCNDLEDMKTNDEFKTSYANDNGYKMVRIRYDDDTISMLRTTLGIV
jgi:very-short-patch-repair endonuclease